MKIVKNITALDMAACAEIARCGFLGVDLKGDPYLESGTLLGRGRMRRLIEHGLIITSQDGLFPGMTQTFRLTPAADR
jgi:hypothetical protein